MSDLFAPPPPDIPTPELIAEQKAVRDKRREFRQSVESGFAQKMRGALKDYLQFRTDGGSVDDGIKGIEEVLRDAWPKATSKFGPTCQACCDTGWETRTCWHEQRCQRRTCNEAHPAFEHTYAIHCSCDAGDRMRTRVIEQEDAITKSGRTQKKRAPRAWSRSGV